jgi:hypothetical protein
VRQKEGQKRGEDGVDARLVAALTLQERLTLILAGEPPHDIYVRWKKPHEQPIGWGPNLNDGFLLNIRPFMVEDSRCPKAPPLLRIELNDKWGIDRGANPDANKRDNDVNLTVAQKQEAREKAQMAQMAQMRSNRALSRLCRLQGRGKVASAAPATRGSEGRGKRPQPGCGRAIISPSLYLTPSQSHGNGRRTDRGCHARVPRCPRCPVRCFGHIGLRRD